MTNIEFHLTALVLVSLSTLCLLACLFIDRHQTLNSALLLSYGALF